jgi:glycosyltransferase involved in cell wall biosynthesis
MFLHNLDDRAFSRLTLRLSRELVVLGAELTLVIARRDASAARELPPGIRLVDLRLGRRPTLLGVPRLARALARERLDVIFAHGSGPARAAIAARAIARVRTRVIVVEHVHYSTFYASFHARRGWARRGMTALMYPLADRVAAVSPGAAHDLESRFPALRGRTAVLPSPGPDSAELQDLVGGIPDHPWYREVPAPRIVCCVANVLPRKGQDTLLSALPRLREAAGDVRLVLIGRFDDAGYAQRLAQLASDLGVRDHVALLGYRAEPLPFVARSDVFALASRSEGFGMAMVEAMACGVPVVAADCPTGPAYVLDGGRAGLLVQPDDPVAMAEAICRVLTDPDLAGRLASRGRERAALFSPSNAARAYLRLAEEVVGH